VSTILAATGHRPPRLGLGYDPASNKLLTDFAVQELRKQSEAHNIIEVVSGFAQGWDQAIAHAAVILGLPLVAAIPFEGQESKWPPAGQERYHALLKRAKLVHVVAKEYSNKAFLLRDKWMVDRCSVLLALWDGGPDGGTAHTVKYAEDDGCEVVNVWQGWQKFKGR